MSIELYNHLSVYGTVYRTTHYLTNPMAFVKWTEESFNYVKYNPRKDIRRYGLSITSLDGGLSGTPDLDSLLEYNRENNSQYAERDFSTPTPVFDNPSLSTLLSPIKKFLFRTHILKLKPGGYFPAHRDFRGMNISSFRLILPLAGMHPPAFNFIIDDKITHWFHGYIYFVDTAKMHYLFNAGFEDVYMIVMNVDLHPDSIKFVTEYMVER